MTKPDSSGPRNNFFQAMVDSIKRQFPEDVLLSVLNMQLQPEDEGERLLYGDKEVAFLAKLTGKKCQDKNTIDF